MVFTRRRTSATEPFRRPPGTGGVSPTHRRRAHAAPSDVVAACGDDEGSRENRAATRATLGPQTSRRAHDARLHGPTSPSHADADRAVGPRARPPRPSSGRCRGSGSVRRGPHTASPRAPVRTHPPPLAAPCPRRHGELAGGLVPHLRGARRGEDDPRAGLRAPGAAGGPRAARGGHLPDDAADAPVGAGGGAARAPPAPGRPGPAPARRLPGRRADLRAGGDGGRRLRPLVRARDARHRRRGAPPRRRPRVGRELPRPRSGQARALAAALRARRSAPTRRRSRASATTTASPSPTSRTRTRRRCATASAGGSRSSRTTGRSSGSRATTSSRRRSARCSRRARPAAATGRRSRPSCPTACPRILRAAHAKLAELRAGGHRDAGGLVVTADSEHARAVAKALKRDHRQRADRRPAHRGERPPQARRVPPQPRPVDRRGEHGLRGRRHPAPARRRLRDRREDAADLPPDRRALRARRPGPRRSS